MTPWLQLTLRNAAAAAAAVSEPDDLAFLALWKRLMVRKQQLASAALESEPLRSSNQQLRTSLAQAQDTIAQLQDRLKEATAERQKAVADKLQAEDRLVDVQKDREHWKVSEGQQHLACCVGRVCCGGCDLNAVATGHIEPCLLHCGRSRYRPELGKAKLVIRKHAECSLASTAYGVTDTAQVSTSTRRSLSMQTPSTRVLGSV